MGLKKVLRREKLREKNKPTNCFVRFWTFWVILKIYGNCNSQSNYPMLVYFMSSIFGRYFLPVQICNENPAAPLNWNFVFHDLQWKLKVAHSVLFDLQGIYKSNLKSWRREKVSPRPSFSDKIEEKNLKKNQKLKLLQLVLLSGVIYQELFLFSIFKQYGRGDSK